MPINLPNGISLLRLPLAAAFVVTESTWGRLFILAMAGISDILDGWLARRLGQTSRSGQILDPLTDKLFVFAALTSFLIQNQLAPMQLVILLFRDIYVGICFLIANVMQLPIAFRARYAGKAVTAMQLMVLMALILAPGTVGYLVVATGLVAGIAIVDYTRTAISSLRKEHQHGRP